MTNLRKMQLGSLENKADFQYSGKVTYEQLKGRAKGRWIVYSRRSKKRTENQEGQSQLSRGMPHAEISLIAIYIGIGQKGEVIG